MSKQHSFVCVCGGGGGGGGGKRHKDTFIFVVS